MDTIGNAIDKLFTVNLKLINSDFKNISRIDNLNTQQVALMAEIDKNINKVFSGELSENDMVRPQHKTY
jgi:hypothetical protein